MTGTNCDLFTHKSSRSYLNHLVISNAKNIIAAEIHWQTVKVCGQGALNEGKVKKWCRLLQGGGTNVNDKQRSGRANS